MTCLRAREFMGDTLGLTLVRALQTSADRHNDASATFAEGFMSEGGKLGRGCRVVWVKGLNAFASRHLTFLTTVYLYAQVRG